jgi:hypothetical protein
MKNIARLITFFLISVTLSSCFIWKKASEPSDSVSRISDTVRINNGSLIYALPRTVFTVKVEAERTIMIPGPYAAYAEDLLGLKDVLKTRDEHWTVKSMSVNSHEEADPSEYFIIQSTGMFRTNVLAMKKEGVILDINPVNNYFEPKSAGSGELNLNRFRSFDLGSDEYYQVQTDTAFRRVKVDSSFIRIPYIVEKKKKYTPDQLAERAAKRLLELRDGKVMILTGEANVFPQNDASINEINRMEKDYTELFTGKYIIETRIYTYQFIPLKESAGKPFTLFIFSESSGPADPGSGSGKPVLTEVVPEQKTKDITLIESNDTGSSSPGPDKLFYRIPDVANVRISLNGKTLYSSRKLIYQLGEIMQLPSNYIIGR